MAMYAGVHFDINSMPDAAALIAAPCEATPQRKVRSYAPLWSFTWWWMMPLMVRLSRKRRARAELYHRDANAGMLLAATLSREIAVHNNEWREWAKDGDALFYIANENAEASRSRRQKHMPRLVAAIICYVLYWIHIQRQRRLAAPLSLPGDEGLRVSYL